ncbi:hypothetical protein Trydic_g14581 [Trypoxylus dichotomus]
MEKELVENIQTTSVGSTFGGKCYCCISGYNKNPQRKEGLAKAGLKNFMALLREESNMSLPLRMRIFNSIAIPSATYGEKIGSGSPKAQKTIKDTQVARRSAGARGSSEMRTCDGN